jgi:NAD(P)-dependent dehydrogenase (short-subunit alcohol dehydrogenase family)
MTDGTTLTQIAKAGTKPSEEGSYDRELVPATRIGGDKDIGGLIVWLISGAGSYMNGSVVMADGGALLVRPSSY